MYLGIMSYTLAWYHVMYLGWVQCTRRLAQHSRCNACIFTTLYTYYPGCDARMRATCTLVSCHIFGRSDAFENMLHMTCMSYASLNCMSCYSFPVNSHTYTSPAINIKLIFSVSIGSIVTSGALLLFTGTQLRPSSGRLSGTLLPTSSFIGGAVVAYSCC